MNRDTPTRPSVEVFEPRQSTWALIEEHTVEEERTEIKKLIGSSLIEETVDLQREVTTWLEIWRDYREVTDEKQKGPSLPEPPNVRENLVKQIQLFVKLIQEKSARQQRELKRALSPHQTEIVANICEPEGGATAVPERPQTASSARDGRQTPLRPSSSRSQSSCSSRASDHFSDAQDFKSSDDIEKLAHIIREDLEEERDGLNTDIQFLQQCLMEESMFQASLSVHSEPSLKELQDIGLKLEKELLTSDPAVKENTFKSIAHPRSKDMSKPRSTNQSPSSETSPRRVVPSPPSSAPTSKTRTSIIHRKQLTSKVMHFPSEDGFGSNEGVVNSSKNDSVMQAERVMNVPGKKKRTTKAEKTEVIAPRVVSSIGSNSRKLRQLVLDTRENRS